MYRISEDKEKKIITIELSGKMDMDEVKAKARDLTNAILKYDKKEVSLLVLIEKLDPIAQECLPICVNGIGTASEYISNIAIVYKKVVTRMQFERILNEAGKINGKTINSRMFNSKREAIDFLS